MSRLGREALYTKIESATGSGSRSDLELVLQDYGESAPLPKCGLCGVHASRLPLLAVNTSSG